MVSAEEAFMVVRLALAVLLCLSGLGAALATPARIIILRHGEKATAYKLCDIGRKRAEALATTYLGRGAAKSLFPSGEAPAAILAITLHTLAAILPTLKFNPSLHINYAETVLPMRDGLPKFKDVPAAFGGSGE